MKHLWIWCCGAIFRVRYGVPFNQGCDMARQRIVDDGGIHCTPARMVADELEYWTE